MIMKISFLKVISMISAYTTALFLKMKSENFTVTAIALTSSLSPA